MTQDEIIRMAREAGCYEKYEVCYFVREDLERFAALVAAHEREACAKESLEVLENLRKETIAQCQQGMIEAYKLGQSEEREACAKVCEEFGTLGDSESRSHAEAFAAAIRARGE